MADPLHVRVDSASPAGLTRRSVLGFLGGLGIASATFNRALAVEAERAPLDAEAIDRAAWISGVTLDEEQRDRLVRAVDRMQSELAALREFELDADVPPALVFTPHLQAYQRDTNFRTPLNSYPVQARAVDINQLPTSDIDIAFASISTLGQLLRQREISSVELTNLYLDRLDRHAATLNCVVTFTDDLALKQARAADRDLAAGRDRGPLHGIPWGAKDLIAVEGYPTTWGCERYREQKRPGTATVAQRLSEAGAVLIAKLTLGAIAMGDEWYGGRTNNPWNLEQGSSGSSAGSAAATAAGLVAFAIGSETLGSIVSPSRRCGTTGLRPTFGRVSRAGCMPLAWSFDKLGPICRCVEDTALVFAAIHGADGLDPTAVSHPFEWPANIDLHDLRVGYTGDDLNREEFETLRELGVELVQIELPQDPPLGAMTMMLDVESASMFYHDWKDGNEDGLFRWPRIWQAAAYIPAIDYVRAARARTVLMQRMEQAIRSVDLYVGGNDLVLTNLTGHPTVVMPFWSQRRPSTEEANDQSGTPDNIQPAQPGSLTFTGHLYDEATLLVLAEAFQNRRGDHLKRPPLFS